ncbi:hypothetical protein SV7mr_07670 [Stieleria bergensis]|uniref:Response regulatory domain-containing protein n=1 Tax=Stieleria bergensis TaxID=2528025 RepID=A0A517SQ77_9BACT|nr:hypothetical protein SV7mr_07670 [Planctomycetes bacterium SV_7m_r]
MSNTPSESPGKVVFLSGDLMFASRVESAAKRSGLTFQLTGALPDASDASWVIVDLSMFSHLVDELPEHCQQNCPQATIIAYGAHVKTEQLRQARAAGIEHVLTKGQFDQQLPTLF